MSLQTITDATARAETLQKNLHEAEEYVGKIDAWGPRERGKLSLLSVATQIHHHTRNEEPTTHQCAAFDAALSVVIKAHFAELSREALAHMARAYHSALMTQKEALKGVLADVERREADAAPTPTDAELAPIPCASAQ